MVSIGAVGGIREGSYTTWTYKWLWKPTDNFNELSEITYYIDEINGLFYLWWEDYRTDLSPWRVVRFGVYKIADHSTVFESPRTSDYKWEPPYLGAGDFSVYLGISDFYYSGISRAHRTYILMNRADWKTIEVWQAGVKLWSRDVCGDVGGGCWALNAGSISLTGKYILLGVDGPEKLALYEGS